MSKSLLKNIKLIREINKFLKKYKKDIIDIILFGSLIRQKYRPGDIDILILFKEKESTDISYELRKIIKKFSYNVEITNRTYKNLFSSSFLPREDILTEGYSIVLGKKISEGFGYKSLNLFIYSLKKLSKSRRIMFHYALEGRDGKLGTLKEIHGIRVASATILIPIENTERFEEFLKYWNIDYKRFGILISEKNMKYGNFNRR